MSIFSETIGGISELDLANVEPGHGRSHSPVTALAQIPLIDVSQEGPVGLVSAQPARCAELVAAGSECYGGPFVRLADPLSRGWLTRSQNPYLGEIDAVAEVVARRGVYLLNLSYEWSCTSAVAADLELGGNRLQRTLDWPLHGLGRNLVVARQQGTQGIYYNITWPGFVGVVSAMAPGRFAIALNQAPMRRFGLPIPLDWFINRLLLWCTDSIPPLHLLRQVFDECRNYSEAMERLRDTPICLPALITLSGIEPDEGCVIERSETRAAVFPAPQCAANHWLSPGIPGTDRGIDSRERGALMKQLYRTPEFEWLVPPILNDCTRVAIVANAKRGLLMVQGWEVGGPATTVFELNEASST